MIPLGFGSYEVLQHLAPQATSYLCVGVQEGECLRHAVQASPQLRQLVLCDTWDATHGGTNRGTHAHIDALLARLGYTGSVRYLDGPSQQLVPQLGRDVVCDLAYVDGAHDEPSALADFRNVWPRTRLAMVCHDARMPQVWAALTRFLDTADARSAAYANGGHGTLVVFR